MTQAVILCGGRGTRLAEYSTAPKCLNVVAGRPFIIHKLTWLEHRGITDALLLCGPHAAATTDVLRSHYRGDIRWTCFEDDYRGTGGAVLAAYPMLAPMFWLTYGDALHIVAGSLRAPDALVPRHCRGAMTVLRSTTPNVEVRWEYATYGGYVTYFGERFTGSRSAHYLDYGLMALNRDLFSAGTTDGPVSLAQHLAGQLYDDDGDPQLRAVVLSRRPLVHLNTPATLAHAEAYLAQKESTL